MNKKARIAVSGSWIFDPVDLFPSYRRAYANDDYIRSVYEAGGLPYIFPILQDGPELKEAAIQLLSQSEGLILTGGQDPFFPFYGQDIQQKCGSVLPERDLLDKILFETALELKLPILGICRGFQMINLLLGGELLQDLSYSKKPLLKHNQEERSDMPFHRVAFEPGNSFYELFGESVMTNSCHHLAVIKAGEGLSVCGRSSDGVIEAVEDKSRRILGTQFHPEMMSASRPEMAKLFRYFVQLCES